MVCHHGRSIHIHKFQAAGNCRLCVCDKSRTDHSRNTPGTFNAVLRQHEAKIETRMPANPYSLSPNGRHPTFGSSSWTRPQGLPCCTSVGIRSQVIEWAKLTENGPELLSNISWHWPPLQPDKLQLMRRRASHAVERCDLGRALSRLYAAARQRMHLPAHACKRPLRVQLLKMDVGVSTVRKLAARVQSNKLGVGRSG